MKETYLSRDFRETAAQCFPAQAKQLNAFFDARLNVLLDEAVVLLDSHELVKGRVLETSGLTAREASDAICEALGAEGVACVGTKFVIWRKSEKVEQEKKKAAAKKSAKKVSGNYNPVKAGLRARKQAAEQQRKQRKQYFHDKAVSAAIERSRQQKEEQ